MGLSAIGSEVEQGAKGESHNAQVGSLNGRTFKPAKGVAEGCAAFGVITLIGAISMILPVALWIAGGVHSISGLVIAGKILFAVDAVPLGLLLIGGTLVGCSK